MSNVINVHFRQLVKKEKKRKEKITPITRYRRECEPVDLNYVDCSCP